MRVLTAGLIIFHLRASLFQGVQGRGILRTSDAFESRFPSTRNYIQGHHQSYNHGPKSNDYDHPPGHFNIPPFHTHDPWTPNRRTFFHDLPFDPRTSTTPFPTFYQFMTSLFGGRDSPSDHFHYPRHRPTPPRPHEAPHSYRPTEPNYIPPPKPIRASVIKLESITTSPVYSSFERDTNAKYYHNVGSLLNHVLIENSKAQQNFHFQQQGGAPDVQIPPFKPLPVLPRPRYVPAPTHPTHGFREYNRTGFKYPDSVQDQLPQQPLANVKIPYVSEKTIPQIFDTLPTETSPGNHFHFTGESFPPQRLTTTTPALDFLDLIDVRTLNSSGGLSERRVRPLGEAKSELDVTTVRSFPGAVEKVKRPVFKFTKKVSTQPDKSSVERVTNLTVQGLSVLGKDNVSKQVNYLNVKDLIKYEMERVGNSSGSRIPEADNSTKRLVNLNDELSLDARILKDTNWDGLTVQSEVVSTELPEGTSTAEAEVRTHKAAFWEIAGESTTFAPTEATKVASERGNAETTTESWPATRDGTETNEPSTTTGETTTLRESIQALRRSENLFTQKPETEIEKLEATTVAERVPKKRYNRRPKVTSFTPSPTPEELQKRIANRNHFQKRQKPNITIAFGNKNVLKVQQNLGKDEVMKFSDEDVRKRRKIGKRRHLYKRTRPSTSPAPPREHLL